MKIKISALKRFPKSKKYTFTKLPAQKPYKSVGLTDKEISLRQDKISNQDIREMFGTGKSEFGSVSARSIEDLRADAIGTKIQTRKFEKIFTKSIKESRKKTAAGIKGRKLKVKTPTAPTFKQQKAGILKGSGLPKSKPNLRKAKGLGGAKAYRSADVAAEKLYRDIQKRFTGKTKSSPFYTRTTSVFKINKRTNRPVTGFDKEAAQATTRSLEQGFEPKNFYKGLSKSGKISKRYARFIDKSKKFK